MIGVSSIGWWLPERKRNQEEISRDYGFDVLALEKANIYSHAVPMKDDHPSKMAARATKIALDNIELSVDKLDLLIYVGVSKDLPPPWVAAFGVLEELGACNAAAFDLNSRCNGGIDALWLAKSLVENGTYKTVAVCCAERFDYLMGPPRKPESVLDTAYSAGAATAIVTADSHTEIRSFSSKTNPDLSANRAMGPLAGGSEMPFSYDVLQGEFHLWRSQLSMGQIEQVSRFSADGDRYNYPRVLDQASFKGVDFVACSPLVAEPQLRVLEELGIHHSKTLFTVPYLGHIGSSDLFLILGVAISIGRDVGERIVLSTRTGAYANALGMYFSKGRESISVGGKGVDMSCWQESVPEVKACESIDF